MFEGRAKISCRTGIHCRPASAILMTAMPYAQDHTIEIDGENGTASLRSLLELMKLGLRFGDEVSIRVEGPKEEELGRRLQELFSKDYELAEAQK